MGRRHRIWYPGATYHLTARGNRRAAIFNESEDFKKYLTILQDVRMHQPFTLHSYCLMTNHLHLQLETNDSPIQSIMKEIQFRYAVYFNQKFKLDGHVFQGRYGAKVIENTDYFLQVSRYIHRNPLESGMVTAMEDYPWSSFSSYVLGKANPHIDPLKTLSYFREPAHEEYRRYVETPIEELVGENGEIVWIPH
ncbi:REP-associated tyrosine transposase [Bacillus massilinigeriensis]|uniref:REP-associated tyrosine transposase n=1 Tax=Bacillus mediterraneensis TaxID=1805474 RepID=UPI0008F87387|nr:transposase [Bacillus mediterraneensis]